MLRMRFVMCKLGGVAVNGDSNCLFCSWGVACGTCNSPSANQAVLSRLRAAVASFAHEWLHILSFSRP